MRTALLVIDVQESFTRRPYFSDADVPAFLAAQNRLIEGCQAQGIPVVRVLHVSPDGDAGDPFAPASGLVRPLEGLRGFDAATTVHKTRHSALVGTGLDVWLIENGIQKLIISGIRTEQCCETTTRHASDLGWRVDYCLDATLTWDMQHLDGSVLTAADIKARTAVVLIDRFATISSVAQALEASKG